MREYIITTEKGANQQLHELTRCRDCRYRNDDGYGIQCDHWGSTTEENGFCHWAEKREDHEAD